MAVNQWTMSSLLLGFHLMQGVLAGMKVAPHLNKPQATTTRRAETSTERPYIPSILERRMDIKRLLPRKRNLKVKRLMRKMGKDFDSFWMSHEAPQNYLDILTKRNVDSSLEPELRSLDLPSIARKMLTVLDASLHKGNNSNNSGLHFEDPARVMNGMLGSLEHWLVEIGSCPIYFTWQDLGLLYWPRFVRRGSCSLQGDRNPLLPTTTSSKPSPSSSCSWPPGMHCVPGKEKKLRLLRWNCRSRGPPKSNTSPNEGVKIQVSATTSPKVDKSQVNRFKFEVLKEINSLDRDENQPEELEDNFQSITDLRKFLVEKSDLVGADGDNQEESASRTQQEEISNSIMKLPAELPPSISEKIFSSSRKRQEMGNDFGKTGTRAKREAGQKKRADRHGKGRRKGRRRKAGMRCRWARITLPVVQDCFCSC